MVRETSPGCYRRHRRRGVLWCRPSDSSDAAQRRRARVYTYAERLQQAETLEAAAEWREYWKTHRFSDWAELPISERPEWLSLVNLVEEVAALYDRKLDDREVSAPRPSASTLRGCRRTSWPMSLVPQRRRRSPSLFDYCERCPHRSPTRRTKAEHRLTRRRRLREPIRDD